MSHQQEKRQKHAIAVMGVGSVGLLLGFIMLAGGVGYWWMVLVVGLVTVVVGIREFGRT